MRELVVRQDAQCRSVQIIELATARRPRKREHCGEDEQQRERQDKIKDTHRGRALGSGSKLRPYQEPNKTVSELAGIMSAAIKGLMLPVSASDTPTTL